jgi:hypothetical protein
MISGRREPKVEFEALRQIAQLARARAIAALSLSIQLCIGEQCNLTFDLPGHATFALQQPGVLPREISRKP